MEALKRNILARIHLGFQRRSPNHVRGVFSKHGPQGGGLSRERLQACLAELGLPAADTDERVNAIDADGDGAVSHEELGKFLELATPAQSWAASLRLSELLADALPVKDHEAPLEELSRLDEAQMRVICERLSQSVARALTEGVGKLKQSLAAQKAANSAAAKFEVVAMSAGTTNDFYEGLEGRVGGCRELCNGQTCRTTKMKRPIIVVQI